MVFYDIGINRRRRVIQQGDAFFNNVVAAAGYAGPGDVVPGAAAWWGLRAYTSASIGANAVRLRESGGNTEQDFPTIAGGGLDLAAIATFKGANNLFVVKWYDQTGNGVDLLNAVAGSQPSFTLNSIGALPAIVVAPTSAGLTSSVSIADTQPFTFSFVINVTSSGGNDIIFTSIGDPIEFRGLATGLRMLDNNGGSVLDVVASFGAWHATQCIFNGGSSVLYLDGTANTGGGIGSGTLSSTLSYAGTGSAYAGKNGEIGIWPVGLSSGQQSSMNANQHAYWGF